MWPASAMQRQRAGEEPADRLDHHEAAGDERRPEQAALIVADVAMARGRRLAVVVVGHFGSVPACLSRPSSPRPQHSAGRPARAAAARRRPAAGRPAPSAAKVAGVRGDREQVEQLAGRVRHRRLGQDRDLADHLGGHVEDRLHARRIGLAQGPGRRGGEIAVGVGDHRPDRVQRLVDLLGLHRLAAGRIAARRPAASIASSSRRKRRRLPAARRRSSWRSSTASAAPGCRGRWQGRR